MGLVVGGLYATGVHWLFTIPVGVVCYGALLFVTGGLSTDMMREAYIKFRPTSL
jgi:hypothetical protein